MKIVYIVNCSQEHVGFPKILNDISHLDVVRKNVYYCGYDEATDSTYFVPRISKETPCCFISEALISNELSKDVQYDILLISDKVDLEKYSTMNIFDDDTFFIHHSYPENSGQYLKDLFYKKKIKGFARSMHEVGDTAYYLLRGIFEAFDDTTNCFDTKLYHSVLQKIYQWISEQNKELDFLLESIDLLIQGYLAVQAPEFIFGGENSSKSEADKFINEYMLSDSLTNTEVKKMTDYNNLVRNKNTEATNTYWFDVLASETDKLSDKDLQLKYYLSDGSKLLGFWKMLNNKMDLLNTQDEWTKFLIEVRRECIKITGSIKLVKEFEKKRTNLNHDWINQKFLPQLGDIPKYSDIEEQYDFIFNYLKYIEIPESGDDKITWCYDSVVKALNVWPQIKKKIETMLLEDQILSNFVQTDLYRTLICEMISDESSILNRIDMFLKNIDSLNNLDKITREKQLKEFWNLIEIMKEKLSDLSIDRNFADYLRIV